MYSLLYRVSQFATVRYRRSESIFWFFLVFHCIFWTIWPCLTRESLHHDVLEGIAQGLQVEWGYSKHPSLSMWALALVWHFGGHQVWLIYAFAQAVMAIAFIYVWRFNRIFLPLDLALLATLSLELFSFYGFDAHILTPDSFQIPFWVMSIYYFYWVLLAYRWQDFCLLAIIAALGIMVKYQFAILILAMLMFTLYRKKYRAIWQQPWFYVGLLIFLSCLLPHINWLVQTKFLCLDYIGSILIKTNTKPILNLLLGYFANLISILLPLGLVTLVLYRFGGLRICADASLQADILFFAAWWPLLLNLVIMLLFRIDMLGRWLTPEFSFIPTWILWHYRPAYPPQYRRDLSIVFALSFGAFAISALPVLNRNPHCDAYYPNQEMAKFFEQLWFNRHSAP